MRPNILSSLAVVGVIALGAGCGAEVNPAQSLAEGAQRAEDPSLRSSTGTVEFFKDDKGFGFIRDDDSGKDVFVHRRDIMTAGVSSLRRGDRVEYRLVPDPKGPHAFDVVLLDDTES